MIVTIDGLKPDTHYYYELRDAASRTRLLPQAGPGSFHTARPQGSRFTFTVTADSHLDDHTSPEVYLRTLADAKADKPDFHIELGDTFMTEKHASHESAYKQYLAQRFYLGDNGLGVPLYFVLGNHDGEGARGRGNADSGLGVWANLTRKRLFPNPVPDGFYTGDGLNYPEAGLLQDYYAWEWGDALFVVLDPYWFPRKAAGPRDNWTCSLGDAQYQWLTATLERSHAKLRFVFIHNLVGGSSSQGRGGAEAVPFYEWGGRNQDGTPGFALSRPGWSLPIHDLLVRNHVNVVFHGHDHLYAKQDVDGIVYLEVPQPGDPRGSTRSAAEYGYVNGTILGSSGHVRVAVSPTGANVDYISSGGKVAHSFSVPSGAGK